MAEKAQCLSALIANRLGSAGVDRTPLLGVRCVEIWRNTDYLRPLAA